MHGLMFYALDSPFTFFLLVWCHTRRAKLYCSRKWVHFFPFTRRQCSCSLTPLIYTLIIFLCQWQTLSQLYTQDAQMKLECHHHEHYGRRYTISCHYHIHNDFLYGENITKKGKMCDAKESYKSSEKQSDDQRKEKKRIQVILLFSPHHNH